MSTEDENIYDVIEIDDLDFDKRNQTFYYPCPCGDKFAITLVIIYLIQKQMLTGYDIAQCPSCSLQIRVVYDMKYISQNFSEFIQILLDVIIILIL